MSGKEIYELKFKQKTESIISENIDKPYLKGFYNYMRSSRLSCSTIYNYIYFAVNFMNSNKKQIGDINLDDCTEFLSNIGNSTASYQISVYSGLKKFITYLVANRVIEYNPMNYVPRPKFKEKEETVNKREVGYLRTEEIKKYISAVEEGVGSNKAKARQDKWKERDLLIVLLLLNTGMRCAALFKLDVNSVNFNNKTITVNDKGDKVKSYVLTDELIDYIKRWVDKREEILNGKQESALFISNELTRMSQKSISRVVSKYASGIQGKNITPHKLRATYGTQLLEATRDIYFVQQCMGHSSPSTTELYIRGQKNNNELRASDIMSKITFG